jgi:hypothetical protein
MTAVCPNCLTKFNIYGVNPENGKWFFIGKGNPHGYLVHCPKCHKDVRKKE